MISDKTFVSKLKYISVNKFQVKNSFRTMLKKEFTFTYKKLSNTCAPLYDKIKTVQ